jgi:hypothetical protein
MCLMYSTMILLEVDITDLFQSYIIGSITLVTHLVTSHWDSLHSPPQYTLVPLGYEPRVALLITLVKCYNIILGDIPPLGTP